MQELKCDILVIGAGSGGLSVASGATQMGASVILIERDQMGGDCLNHGCVPSKALIAAAKTANLHVDTEKFGVSYQKPKIDFNKVKQHVQGIIDQIAPHDSVERFEGLGVKVIKGQGCFTSARSAEVKNKANIKFKYAVIATGSYPVLPPIPGLKEAKPQTNETIFKIKSLPKHLAIIGAGPIGCEMAQAWNRLGSKVTVLEAFDRIMPHDDAEAVAIVAEQLKKEGIDIITSAGITKINNKGFVELKGKKTIEATDILVAAGRAPSTDDIGLELANVKRNNRGHIEIDDRMRSSNKRIFAIGDVSGQAAFTHMAGFQASVVVQNILFRLPAKGKRGDAPHKYIPWATYTDPELAQVGLTEEKAKSLYPDVQVLKMPFASNDRAKAEGKTKGFIKIIANKKARTLGVTVVGSGAGEQLLLWSMVIGKQLKLSEVAKLIAPYPTISEAHKHLAGSFYTKALFSEKTKKIVRFLLKLS